MTPPRRRYGLATVLLVLLTTAPASPLAAHPDRLTTHDDADVTFWLYHVGVVTPTASLMPAERLYWPGDTATVTLDLDAVTDLYGLSGTLTYDTTRLHFDDGSLAPGALLDDGSTRTSEHHDEGALAFSAWRTGGGGVTGSGSAVTMRFSVKDFAPPGPVSGTASIVSLSALQAVDLSGAAIPLIETHGSFRIGGVWPGDTDNNCRVDHDDLLPVGAHFGERGPPRPGRFDITWEAKAFQSWGDSLSGVGFTRSFIDATGDGVIDHRDVLAVGVNRGAAHEPGCVLPGAGKQQPPLSLRLDPQPVGTVITVHLELAESAQDLLGTAFTLETNTSALKLSVVEAGALLDDGDLLEMVDLDAGEAAFTRKGAERAVRERGTLAVLTLEVVGPMSASTVLSLSTVKLSTASSALIAAPEQAVVLRRVDRTAVLDTADAVPGVFVLASNYPNPFNAQTTIRYDVPEPTEVRLVVYDVLGREVRVLVEDRREAGMHAVVFEAEAMPSGLYLYRLETPQGSFVKKMLLVN